jgi:methionyl-tRNA formyltransferase
MKIVFAGTPDFAAIALEALHDQGHDIALVVTQPDRPAGRGLHAVASAVKRRAQSFGLEVTQPPSLKTPEFLQQLALIDPEVMIVAAYGLMIPAHVLALPRLGCINIHASMLPRWRGAAPIQRALLAGDRETGISIMQMDAGLDTGPVLLQQGMPIGADDTARTLHDKLATLGASLVLCVLDAPHSPKPQDDSCATYAAKIDKREARIEWNEPAEAIALKVRAFNPVPGAATTHSGTILKIWRARVGSKKVARPGTVMEAGAGAITIACGSGTTLDVLELQRAGGKRLPPSTYLAGNHVKPGDRVGAE